MSLRCREKVKEARRERSQNNRPRPIIVIFCFLAVDIHPITVRLRQPGNSDDESGYQQRKGEDQLQISHRKSCRTKPWAIGSSPNGHHGPLHSSSLTALFTKMPAAKCQSSNYGTRSSRNSRSFAFFSTDVQADSYTL